MSFKVLILIVLLLGGAAAAFQFVIKPNFLDVGTEEVCLGNLAQVGKLLSMRIPGNRLERLDGPDYLLQAKEELKTPKPSLFLCPGHEDAAPGGCSYRGPDWRMVEESLKEGWIQKPVIVACCANGENGDSPYHEKGVCVLFDTGQTEFFPWTSMKGYEGGPVPVGPDSPDPRFQHLVR